MTYAYPYPFTEGEAQHAAEAHGFNCGPLALAWALQVKPAAIVGKIPGFAERGYTSPAMMRAALNGLQVPYRVCPLHTRRDHVRQSSEIPAPDDERMFHRQIALVRIQWTGPWTAPRANGKWAYQHTHWVAAWRDPYDWSMIFDCNGGLRTLASWEAEIVPLITGTIPRADGGWFPTHVWRLEGNRS